MRSKHTDHMYPYPVLALHVMWGRVTPSQERGFPTQVSAAVFAIAVCSFLSSLKKHVSACAAEWMCVHAVTSMPALKPVLIKAHTC